MYAEFDLHSNQCNSACQPTQCRSFSLAFFENNYQLRSCVTAQFSGSAPDTHHCTVFRMPHVNKKYYYCHCNYIYNIIYI